MPSPHFNGLGISILGIHKDAAKAIFKPKVGEPQPVEVIFHARYQPVDLSGQEYGAPNPTAWVATSLINPEYLDTIEINGIDYSIVNVAPDGLELTQLDLDEP